MDKKGSQHASAETQEENDSILFLSEAARAVLSDETVSVQRLKVLYRKPLQRVENMVETARLGSFGQVYARCGEDFEALLHDRLSVLEPALKRLEHLVADLKR